MKHKTERSARELMLAGETYSPADPELAQLRDIARQRSLDYNRTNEDEEEKRLAILQELLGSFGSNSYIEPYIHFDYGVNTFIGDYCYLNFDCIFLDCNRIELKDHVMVGPRVQFLTALHPLDPIERKVFYDAEGKLQANESAKPIIIGKNVWIGAGALILPGVEIGENSVIGAGSIVNKSIPDNVFAAGNPCKVIRKL